MPPSSLKERLETQLHMKCSHEGTLKGNVQ